MNIPSSDSRNPRVLPSKCKFLTRNLQISSKPKNVLRKVCVKRFFIKNFTDHRKQYDNDTEDLISKLIKENCFKTLRSVSLLIVSQGYLRNDLKTCKNIKKFHLAIHNDQIEMNIITMILKKLSRNMQMVRLEDIIPNSYIDQNFYGFAKTILRFPKIQYFERSFGACGNFDSFQDFQKELRVYNRFALRLKEMKKIIYGFSLWEQDQFQAVMENGRVYSGINGLIMNLELDYLFKKIGCEVFGVDDDSLYKDIAYDLDDEEDDPNNQEVIMKYRMREEIKPFFRFELFPNLKKLDIIQDHGLCTLTSFVGDGFQHLKNLQELNISFEYSRSTNTMYLFKRLIDLPPLQKFTLCLRFIKSEEWNLLEQFLKGQEKLKALSLCVTYHFSTKAHYLDQNASLKTIIESLANKHFLKSLELKSPFWSLEALSKGFSHLPMVNQLHALIIEASDDTITSDEKPVECVKGLSQFLENQQASLKTLKISLSLVLWSQIISHIATAMSNLKQIQELDFSVNSYPYGSELLCKYFRDNLQENMDQKKGLTRSQTWTPDLARGLQKLENLRNLTLTFDMLGQSQRESVEWFIDIMKTLPKLERLRKIKLVPKTRRYLLPVEQKIINAVLQLRNIRGIKFKCIVSHELHSNFLDLQKALQYVNERQSIRSDLMF